MTELAERRCVPCEGGVTPMSRTAAEEVMQRLDEGWQLADDGASIQREFRFRDFFRTMSFVNALAHVANLEDHHPDLSVHYNKVVVRYSTHSVGGLSDNDFICATKLDALL